MTWDLPEGWALHTDTEVVEVTRDGTQPPYVADVIRRYAARKVTAWLTAPDGQTIPLPSPFTLGDVETIIAQHAPEAGE